MGSVTAGFRAVAQLSGEAGIAVRIDTLGGSSDCPAKHWNLGSGSRTMRDIQGPKDKASGTGPGTGRRTEYWAKIEERGKLG